MTSQNNTWHPITNKLYSLNCWCYFVVYYHGTGDTITGAWQWLFIPSPFLMIFRKWRNVVSCYTATTAGFLKKFYFFACEYCSYQMINAWLWSNDWIWMTRTNINRIQHKPHFQQPHLTDYRVPTDRISLAAPHHRLLPTQRQLRGNVRRLHRHQRRGSVSL